MDITDGRWVDLRFERPVQKVKEATEAEAQTATLENSIVAPI